MIVPFNKPYATGSEIRYMQQALEHDHISGNGDFTKRCHHFFEHNYGFRKALLTTSCTDALEMAALLAEVGPGDEVIMPAYTFVSTANAFVLRGAHIVFADSLPDHPNIDPDQVAALVTPRTRVIVLVHYGGVACEMGRIMEIAHRHDILVVEDAAQAIEATYRGKALGGIGHLGAFSFHETKNIICGEGGLLAVNDEQYIRRAEILWEKGTDRAAFYRGEVDRYTWRDAGSSFLPSDMLAAFLWAQLEARKEVQALRMALWQGYYAALLPLAKEGHFSLSPIPEYASNNANMFYLICHDGMERSKLLAYLRSEGVHAVFHYLSLHQSPYYADKHDGRELQHCERFADCLLRLPFYTGMKEGESAHVIEKIAMYFNSNI